MKTGKRLTQQWPWPNAGLESKEHASSATSNANSATSSNSASAHRARSRNPFSSSGTSTPSGRSERSQKMPWREADGRYWGPGVLDMKAGVVMALAALNTLREIEVSSSRNSALEQ